MRVYYIINNVLQEEIYTYILCKKICIKNTDSWANRIIYNIYYILLLWSNRKKTFRLLSSCIFFIIIPIIILVHRMINHSCML